MSQLLIKMSREHDGGESGYASDTVKQILDKYSATLVPVDDQPAATDRYYMIQGCASDDMESLRSDLSGLDEVEAAYIKPADELP